MKMTTKMYLKLFEECNYNHKEYEIDECNEIEEKIVQVIEENLKEYGIKKYDYEKEGGTPLDAFAYYIDQMTEKYDPEPLSSHIMQNIRKRKDVIRFLDWYKEIENGIVGQFDYKIINMEEISDVMAEYSYYDICIKIEDYCSDISYNPIICWLNTQDIPTLYIMSWNYLKNEAIEWVSTHPDVEDSFIKEFDKPTLEKYIKNEFGEFGDDVCSLLEHEVNEFYNIYKDDFTIAGGILFSKSKRKPLHHAIWEETALFSSYLIAKIIREIYDNEINL